MSRGREFDLAVIADRDGPTVVALSGEIDAYTVPRLRDQLSALLEQGRSAIRVDLRDVSFIDSSGLSALITANKQARRLGGDLVLHGPNPAVFRVLEIAGLTRVFTFSDVTPASRAGGASAS